jgi:long-chain acyl-CoA synthetase
MLKEHHLISHAMVYGEGRSYLVALITLNALELADYARHHQLSYTDHWELARSPDLTGLIQESIDKVNARVSSTESIKRFAILARDFQLENDEVTPTGKIKREVIYSHFSDVIEKLYRVSATADTNGG